MNTEEIIRKNIIEDMSEGVMTVGLNGVISHVNPAAEAILGLKAEKLVGKENVLEGVRGMGGEDFSFLTRKKPCSMFRVGITNSEDPNTNNPLHSVTFDADERCFDTAIPMFVNFVLDNQDGIEL